jgi:hypothetical protein
MVHTTRLGLKGAAVGAAVCPCARTVPRQTNQPEISWDRAGRQGQQQPNDNHIQRDDSARHFGYTAREELDLWFAHALARYPVILNRHCRESGYPAASEMWLPPVRARRRRWIPAFAGAASLWGKMPCVPRLREGRLFEASRREAPQDEAFFSMRSTTDRMMRSGPAQPGRVSKHVRRAMQCVLAQPQKRSAFLRLPVGAFSAAALTRCATRFRPFRLTTARPSLAARRSLTRRLGAAVPVSSANT